MPRKPQRPCRYPGCPHLTDGVYCEEHAKVMEQHYEKFQRGYSPGKRYGRAWKRIRDRYVHKHPLCEQCLKEGRYVCNVPYIFIIENLFFPYRIFLCNTSGVISFPFHDDLVYARLLCVFRIHKTILCFCQLFTIACYCHSRIKILRAFQGFICLRKRNVLICKNGGGNGKRSFYFAVVFTLAGTNHLRRTNVTVVRISNLVINILFQRSILAFHSKGYSRFDGIPCICLIRNR